MKLTVTTLSDDIYILEVANDMELENFKALLEFECSVPASQIALFWNGRPLHDDKMKLVDYGLKDGEVLLLQHVQGAQGQWMNPRQAPAPAASGGLPNIDFTNIQMPEASGSSRPQRTVMGMPDDPATIREILLSSPHELALLKERNPPLAEALLSGSLEKFTEVLRKQQQERSERDRERVRMLNSDPFDPDVQNQIAEEIRLKNVESNMETAMEFAPESFGQVVMLYVDCHVNGHPVKAFVDSGAQMTIMSKACAERCNIMRLVDTRWAGIAKGVGQQRIIGRVHLCQIQIGPDYLQSSFSILEDQPMDMLLGLDMLKRHQCCIDLKQGVLVIGTTGTQTRFLSEGDLPDHARLNRTLSQDTQDEDRQLAEALSRSAQDSNPGTNKSSTGGASTSSSSVQPRFPEADILKLTNHGFPRHQVLEELQRANGNVDQALAALFAKSFQVPQ